MLDSYILYRSSRLSVIHSIVVDDDEKGEGGKELRYVACAALSSINDTSTSIIALNLNQQDNVQQCIMKKKVR